MFYLDAAILCWTFNRCFLKPPLKALKFRDTVMKTLIALLAAAGALQAPRSRASQPPRRGAVALDAALVPLPVAEALAAGPLGVPAMAAVGAAVLTPLTMYRQGYSFSVGYGAAVAAMGAALYFLNTLPGPTSGWAAK